MQVVSSQTDAGDPVQWRRILALGIGFLSVLLAGSALVFWIASNWPQMSPDGRLRLVQGVLALLVCVTTGLAWRGSPWAEHAAGLAALATGALLALMGQIYQTGADAWELFFAWAMLLLPWLVLLRSAVLALLWVLLLNLTYVTWAGTSSILWWGDWFGLALMLLNGALLALAEGLRTWLRDPWHLARRVLAGCGVLFWACSAIMQGSFGGLDGWGSDGLWQWQGTVGPGLGVLAIGAVYVFYARVRRDLAVVSMALLAGIVSAGLWLGPRVSSELGLIGLAVVMLLLGMLAVKHVLWLRQHEASGDGSADPAWVARGALDAETALAGDAAVPWYLIALRVGVLIPAVSLLAAGVGIAFRLDTAAAVLGAGAVAMLPGLFISRTAGRALGREFGGVLAALGLLLCAAGVVWLAVDESGGLALHLALLLAAGGAVYAGTRQFAVRLLAAGVVLGIGCYLTFPQRWGWHDELLMFDGLAWRAVFFVVFGAAAWLLSMRAGLRLFWRPLGWASMTVAAVLAGLVSELAAGPVWVGRLPVHGALAALAVLPGVLLGAWMSTVRPALPPLLRFGVPAVCCAAGLGWMGAPLLAVALTGVVLGGWSRDRLPQVWSLPLALGGIALYYFNTTLDGGLIAKSVSLGLAAAALAALTGVLALRYRLTAGIVAGRRHGRLAAGVLAGGVLILGLVLARVQYYKTILSEGQPVALALAPVDPRSLMQGDYMDLDYAIRRQVEGWLDEHPPVKDALDASGRGWLLLRLDGQGVGQLQEVTAEAPSDADDQTVALVFRWRPRERSGWQSSGADWGGRNWFFPEGQGARYEKARYGVLRVAPDGKSLLAELLDEGMKPL